MMGQDTNINMDLEAKIEISEVLREEEIMWAQKAMVKWLQLGDKNTNYFQIVATICKMRNEIRKIKDGNSFLWNYGGGLEQIFVQEFKLRFSCEGPLLLIIWLRWLILLALALIASKICRFLCQ